MLDKQINKTRILFESLKKLSIKEDTNLIIKSLKYDGNDIKCICKGYDQHLYFIDSSTDNQKINVKNYRKKDGKNKMKLTENLTIYANFDSESEKYKFSGGIFNNQVTKGKKGKKDKTKLVANFVKVNFSTSLKEDVIDDLIEENDGENFSFKINITDGWLSCYEYKKESYLTIFINEGKLVEDDEDDKKSKSKSKSKSKVKDEDENEDDEDDKKSKSKKSNGKSKK